jgi:uncharacterized protein YodC (DUF2158 family)
MAERKVKKGSLVRGTGGGPVMTVDAIVGDRARCTWYEDDVQHHGSFDLGALSSAEHGRRTWADDPEPPAEAGSR